MILCIITNISGRITSVEQTHPVQYCTHSVYYHAGLLRLRSDSRPTTPSVSSYMGWTEKRYSPTGHSSSVLGQQTRVLHSSPALLRSPLARLVALYEQCGCVGVGGSGGGGSLVPHRHCGGYYMCYATVCK